MEDFLWTEKYRPKTIGECVLPSGLKQTLSEFISKGDIPNLILSGGPNAVRKGKELINHVVNNIDLNEAIEYTAKMIAEIRKSDEGQEGMNAFLEKRKPNWIDE